MLNDLTDAIRNSLPEGVVLFGAAIEKSAELWGEKAVEYAWFSAPQGCQNCPLYLPCMHEQIKPAQLRTVALNPSNTFLGNDPAPERRHPGGGELKPVTLITDGACIGNPGPGGWACILRHKRHKRELYGSEPHSTNNRMELAAVIHGLRALKEPCRVTVITDSQYVKNGITSWIHRWKSKGWRTKAKTPVLNKELWMALDQEAERHEVHWEWVKGHADHADNIRCDELATQAAREQL